MGVLLDNGKYQVLENLFLEDGYTASVCIDIENRNNYKPLVFNIYSQPSNISELLPFFYGISPGICDGFHRVIPGNRCIMAFFDYHHGVPLIDHLNALSKDDYPARAQIAGSFLDAMLFFDMMPTLFTLSALTPPNTVFDVKEKAVRFNYVIKPLPQASEDEKWALFAAYIKKIFVKSRYLPDMADKFLQQTLDGGNMKFVPICAAWRQVSAAAMEEYEKYKKESIFGYIKRRLLKKRRGKRKQSGTDNET